MMKSLLLGSGMAILLASFSSIVQAQDAPSDSILHRLILIGDAGRLYNGKNPVVDAVSARHSLTNERTTLLYLGDNVYPSGLTDEASPDYKSLTTILRYQASPGRAQSKLANPGAGKGSNIIFISGNHDWGKGRPDGWEKIKRQGQWLDSLQSASIRMLPTDGCPGPEVIVLDEHLLLVILDTQWWLHPYEKPGVSSSGESTASDCSCKNEAEILAQLTDIAHQHKDKGIILATHHPFRSYGIHGGYYTLKQHLFPLTDFAPSLYIPLPIIGSLYPLVRGAFGTIQDVPNPAYQHMIRQIEAAMNTLPNVLFVAGHDHALQHIVSGKRTYIGSGSGINRERVKWGKEAQFVSSEWGYVVVDHLQTGKVKATFFTVDEEAKTTIAHTADVFTLPTKSQTPAALSEHGPFPERVLTSVASGYDSVGHFHRWLLGENYRKEWAMPISMPVFDLQRTHGGYTILQRGGGQQTKSLRLKAIDGKEWVLRTVQKAPDNALPDYLKQTIASAILQDEISAANPYAPLTVPILATAAGVPHANPIVYYVPNDPALGDYQIDFSNTVCLLEERNPGGSEKSLSTPNLLKALEEDNTNRVDQRAVLRARLLDLFIGDWDRHEDQWRWGSRSENGGKVFYPIPRDRDQVFFKGDGPLMKLAALSWLQPKFQGFRDNLPNVNGFMYNGRYFDRLFLTELSTQDWLSELEQFSQAMTDSVLQIAINQLPPPIFQLSGNRILETLKVRRGKLFDYGMTYYRFLAKTVMIPASDKAELIQIQHQDDDHLAVSIFNVTEKGAKQQIYSRVFDAALTKEIQLYGQGGNDQFLVNGLETDGIKVRLIGGKGDDTYTIGATTHRRQTLIYDRSTETNVFPSGRQAIIHTTTDKSINQFDGHSFKYDLLAPLATAGYNLDDGLLLGAGFQWTIQGFRKAPFAAQHKLLIAHALATNATSVKYDAQFTHVIGKNDLWINAYAKAPDNVTNFFGPGNETVFDKNESIRYYRTRYNLINLTTLLKRSLSDHVHISVGPLFQYFRLDINDNQGRFIERYLRELPESERFLLHESYGGLQAGLVIDNRNNTVNPSRGIHWSTSLLGMQGVGQQRNHMAQFRTDLSMYTSFSRSARLVIANRIGAGLTVGSPAFYQLLYLGGHDNLRGFRTYRFAGSQLLYHSLEARLKLFDFNSYLFPGSAGLIAFNDVGRVWQNGESSNRWHDGYGGGFYVSPARLLVITGSVAFSEEGTLPYFSVGYRF